MRLFFILLLTCSAAIAGDLTLSGYMSQSVVKSDGISIGGSTGKYSFDKREVNLFADYSCDCGLTARVAVGTIDEPYMRDRDFYVKYALIEKQWKLDNDIAGIRVGRVPHMFGFYNTARMAPTTGQFIYQPEGLPGYHENFKYIAMSGDGVQGYYYKSLGQSTSLEVTATYTKAGLVANREVVGTHINDGRLGTFDPKDSYVRGITLELKSNGWFWYYNWNDMYFDFKPDNPYLPTGHTDTQVHTTGIKKYVGNFEFSAEYLTVRLKGETWKKLVNTDSGNPTGFALIGTWHATEKLDLSYYHTEYYMQDGDKSGIKQSEGAARVGAWRPASWYYTKANSVAMKYILDKNWSARVQYTRGTGTAAFSKTVNWHDNKDWNYVAAQLIYSF